MIRMKADVNNVIAGQNKVTANQRVLNTTLSKTNAAGIQAAAGLNVTKNKLAAVESSAHGAHGSMTDMIKSMAIMSAVMGTIGLGAKLVTDLATFQDLRVRLQSMSDGAADYAEKENFLIDLAKEHHKELSGLASGYAGLSVMVKENIINDEQARQMLTGLSNAASATGASTDNLKQVFYGLNQTLGQGTVQAQELNQVVEPMPGLLSKLAKVAGQETGAAFRKLVGDGKITSEMFAKYMVKALAEYDGAAAKTASNINAKFSDISTSYLLLAKNLEQPINNALVPVLDGLDSGLNTLSDNADTVSNVVFGSFALAMAHATKAVVSKTAATAKELVASRANALSAKTQAKAEYDLAVAYKASAVGSAQNNIADKRLMASRTALTTATKAASIAQKSLSVTMGALGGPAGIAMLAAWGLYEFASNAFTADKNVSGLSRTIEVALGKQKELATNALNTDIDERLARIAQLQQKVAEINSKLSAGFNQKLGVFEKGVINDSINEMKVLGNEITQLKAKISSLSPKSKNKSSESPQNKKALNVFTKQRDALIKQVALLGKSSELAKTRFDIEQGRFKNLLPAQKKELLNIAKNYDAKKAELALAKAKKTADDTLQQTAKQSIATYQKKMALMGKSSELAKVAYAIEHGELQGVNDTLKQQLLLQAKLIDQKTVSANQSSQFNQLRNNLDPRFAEQANNAQNLSILNNELDSTPEDEVGKRQQINTLIEAEQQRHSEEMNRINGSVTTEFDALWAYTFDNFARGIGDATASAIMEGESFSEIMQNIGRGVIKQVISGLVEIGVKKLALAVIEKGINKAAATSSAGVMIANAGATSMQAGLAAFASTAAIPIVGPILAPGAMAAALAITSPMVGVIAGTAGAMAGMAHDGIDEIPREGTWLLDKGERVVDSRTNQDLKQALNNGSVGSSGDTISITSPITIQGNADESVIADLIERNYEAVYNAMVQAKADRGEAA